MRAALIKIGRRIADVDGMLRRHITDPGDPTAGALERQLDVFLLGTFGVDTVEYERYRVDIAHIVPGYFYDGITPQEIADSFRRNLENAKAQLEAIKSGFEEELEDAGHSSAAGDRKVTASLDTQKKKTSEGLRTIPPTKAINVLRRLLAEAGMLMGEPFASPKRSQWTATARGALEKAWVSDSLLQSFDASQAIAFSANTSDEDMRKMANSNLEEAGAVLNSAIEQLRWEIEPDAKEAEESRGQKLGSAIPKGPPFKSSVSTFDVSADGLLIVNGEVWNDTRVEHDTVSKGGMFFGQSISKVAELTFEDLAGFFNEIEVCLPGAKKDPYGWEFAYVEPHFDPSQKGTITVVFRLEYDLEFWNKDYSIANLAEGLTKVLARNETGFEYWQRSENTTIEGFGVCMTMSLHDTVQSALSKEQELKELVSLVITELASESLASINLAFNFPAPIKSACEQYLLYFVQFLSDLGIEASAQLKEEANRVLFSVTPADRTEALEKIRDALGVYLGLAVAPEIASAASQFQDLAVFQLHANVLHLQSQLALARAAAEMKSATLDAKDAQIALLQDRIDLRVFQPRRQPAEGDPGKEELIKDLMSVKKWDYKCFEINLPEVLRKLKRRVK